MGLQRKRISTNFGAKKSPDEVVQAFCNWGWITLEL